MLFSQLSLGCIYVDIFFFLFLVVFLFFFFFLHCSVEKNNCHLYNGYTLGKFLSVKYIFYCVNFIYFSVNQYFSSGFR